VTNLLVDKVAEAMFSNTHGFPAWDELTDEDRDLYRTLAQAAVDASLSPFAQWLCDAGYLAEPFADDDTVSGNPQVLLARWLEIGDIVAPPAGRHE
jgi:hypothetical protein